MHSLVLGEDKNSHENVSRKDQAPKSPQLFPLLKILEYHRSHQCWL